MKSNDYLLKFTNNSSDTADNNKISLNDDYAFKDPKVKLKMLSISIDKEMYKPACAKACLSVIRDVNDGDLKDDDVKKLTDFFMKMKMDIYESDDKKEDNKIASGYIVMSLTPRRTFVNGKMALQLDLVMYSPDKFIDKKKYSQCYTAQRLGSEILQTAMDNVKAKQSVSITCDYQHQQNLQFKLAADKEPPFVTYKVGTTNYLEAIQPYLVQYNETLYSLIARTANRCGEFFFYENGKLYLGLDTTNSDAVKKNPEATYAYKVNELSVTPTTDTKVKVLKTDEIANIEYNVIDSEDEAETQFSDYTDDKASMYAAKGVMTQTYEGPSGEYVQGYPDKKKDKSLWGTLTDKTDQGSWYFPLLMPTLQKDSVLEMLSYIAINKSMSAIFTKRSADATNASYIKDFVKAYKDGETPKKEKEAQVGDDQKIYQFCAATQFGMNQMKDFYQNVKERSAAAKKRSVKVTMIKGAQTIIKLGDFVNLYGREYVVTRVHQSGANDTATTQLKKEELVKLSVQEIEAKVLANNKQQNVDNDWFEAVPALMVLTQKDKDKKTYAVRFAPMPLADNGKRTAVMQRAYVINNNDPLDLGRVRILYPWQAKDPHNASPFIRVTVPMASSRGGIRFRPQLGDEVMVGYEFDDIERPFVIGAVPSAANNGGSAAKSNNDVIRSPNGHKIVFNNPKDGSNFAKAFFPVLKPLGTLGVKAIFETKNVFKDVVDPTLGGSMQFTDEQGVYNVELSTEKRSISIKSPLGNVSIDALTGITINCPTGDVNIKGKNVKIEAMDKLDLISGSNIKKQKFYQTLSGLKRSNAEDEGGSTAVQLVSTGVGTLFNTITGDGNLKGLLTPIDVGAVRVIMDSLLKPVNGTLTIKSNRFMKLEAGSGKTTMPNMYRAKKKDSIKETKDSSNYKYRDELAKEKHKAGVLIQTLLWAYEEAEAKAVDDDMREQQFKNMLINCEHSHFSSNQQIDVRYKYDDVYCYAIKGVVSLVKTNFINKIEADTKYDVDAQIDKIKMVFVNEEVQFTDKEKRQLKDCLEKWAKYTKSVKARLAKANTDRLLNLAPTVASDSFTGVGDIIKKCREEVKNEPNSIVRKRMFIYKALDKLNQQGNIKLKKESAGPLEIFSKEKKYVNIANIDVCKDTIFWKRYLSCLSIETKSFGKIIGRTITDFMGWSPLLDVKENSIDLWYPSVNGQILIADSNTGGNTFSLDGKNNTFIATEPDEFSKAIKILKDI